MTTTNKDRYFNRKRIDKHKRQLRCINCKGKMQYKREGNYYRLTCPDCGFTELKKKLK